MLNTIGKIISDVLRSIYQPFIFAIALSVAMLFFVLYLDKCKGEGTKEKVKNAFKDLKEKFLSSARFRRFFYFDFFAVMVLFKTLLLRQMWINPLTNVVGVWGLYDKHGKFTTESVENFVLFIPLVFFLLFYLETTSKKVTKFLPVMAMVIACAFLISLTIEMLQLFLRVGTWQLSDLCFNTLGGVVGGLIYWITAKIRRV
ncbi:MAG: VanZ family protein [Eubacterium sp.]|nr:VanZ family protein [Eubacterium sp.]